MTITPSIKRDYLANLAIKGKRADGRELNEYRNIELETNIISKAEGSARVKIGNTQVVVGIKMDVGEPYPDSPESGVMTTAAELIPLASPDFEAGPPRENAIELARVVDRGVRESETVDVKKLCIQEGKKVYMVFCDIYPLEFDGNLLDAASMAANAALNSARYEEHKWEDGEAVPTGNKVALPIQNMAVECTVSKIGESLVIDPHIREEFVQDCRITMAIDEKGNLTAMQKGGGAGPITLEQIDSAITMALDRAKDNLALIKESIKQRET